MESYLATEGPRQRPVVVRRALPWVMRDHARLASLEARVSDLRAVRHPLLVPVTSSFRADAAYYFVEQHVDGVSLERVVTACRQAGRAIPPNIFLHVATQVCSALEALHARAGRASTSAHVLHLHVRPRSIFLTRDGRILLGSYGWVRSPLLLPSTGASGPAAVRIDHVAPEQTRHDQRLTPMTDIFSLGAVLYEAVALAPLFRGASNVETLARIRAPVPAGALESARERVPGLERVLARALAEAPSHRYPRALVLREDLRGLMAGYSFTRILEEVRDFVAPLLPSLYDAAFDGVAAADAAPDEELPVDPTEEVTAPRVPARPRPARSAPLVEPPPMLAIDLDDPSTAPNLAPGLREDLVRDLDRGARRSLPRPHAASDDPSTLPGTVPGFAEARRSLALRGVTETDLDADDTAPELELEELTLDDTDAEGLVPPPPGRGAAE